MLKFCMLILINIIQTFSSPNPQTPPSPYTYFLDKLSFLLSSSLNLNQLNEYFDGFTQLITDFSDLITETNKKEPELLSFPLKRSLISEDEFNKEDKDIDPKDPSFNTTYKTKE